HRGGHQAGLLLGPAGVHVQRGADQALRRPVHREPGELAHLPVLRRRRGRAALDAVVERGPAGRALGEDHAVDPALDESPGRQHDADQHRPAPERRLPADPGRVTMRMGRTPIDRRDAGEQGIALVTVLLALTALLALSSAAVAYGVGSEALSRHDQNWNA